MKLDPVALWKSLFSPFFLKWMLALLAFVVLEGFLRKFVTKKYNLDKKKSELAGMMIKLVMLAAVAIILLYFSR